MRNQFTLVVLLVFVAACVTSSAVTPPNEKENEIVKDEQHEKPRNLIGALNPHLNKMILMPKDNQPEVKHEKSSEDAKSTEKKESKTVPIGE
jgi:hypothetical protein